MRRVVSVPVFMMAAWLAVAADSTQSKPASNPAPQVLRNQNSEPADDVIVTLPGAPPAKPEDAKPANAEPSKPGPAAEGASHNGPKVFYPPAFLQNSALFCQKMIGEWSADDARFLLGQPLRQRPAYGDNQSVNGQIYAFADPTGRFKELELDFESGSGLLRTVFVYPQNMTWQDCRRQWGGDVSATEANKGRKFYSYMDRRLDVLVDSGGKVISLGLY